jgi:guanine deaminase
MAHLTDLPVTGHRGAILRFLDDPGSQDAPGSYQYFEDGLLLVAQGKVVDCGPYTSLASQLPTGSTVTDHGHALLLPGFIDTHVHYPQLDVMGAGGRELLDWLNDHTFPQEARFSDAQHAAVIAELFLDQLLTNGTTTALVFCTVHPQSVDAFFTAAQQRSLRMIAGKVLMDRNCPEYLCDTAETGQRDTEQLIARWHGSDRLAYAITPRFAPTSSPAQLQGAGELAALYPDVYVHSHLAENQAEIDWVKQLYPQARSYLDVYDSYGLLRPRSLYAHCLHLDERDRQRMAQTGAVAAFCPTSNLYLGSGLFDIAATDKAGQRFAIATDVGGGTSFSLIRTLDEACKVAKLTGQYLSPLRAFYLITLGAAKCLDISSTTGTLAAGSEADFVVLDLDATPLLSRRTSQCQRLSDLLGVLITLADERVIAKTYIQGQAFQSRHPTEPHWKSHRT